MSSLREDLYLERIAVIELEAESAGLWSTGHYVLAQEASAEARKARARVAELERELGE